MEQKISIFKLLFIIFFLFLFSNKIQSQNLIKGKAKVIDGDTIHIGKDKIRLHGIDAPEIKQTCKMNNNYWNCGIESQKSLIDFILLKDVNCEIIDTDQYKRLIGICYVDNKNINQYMVKNGWAIAYRHYSLKFVKDEEFAKKNKLGIWIGSFEDPYIFRKKNRF